MITMHQHRVFQVSRTGFQKRFYKNMKRTLGSKSFSFLSHPDVKQMDRKEVDLVSKEEWKWTQPKGHDTGIKIRNSYHDLRSQGIVVPLIVANPNYVTWYSCGPTVYDSSHIGHASTYIQCDLIRRALMEYFGLNICMVMGITNMDNKIINRALLNDRDVMEVADTYEAQFKRDMKTLNVLPPTTYIRVTDIIPQIILFIQKLLEKNQAYITASGNVYFSYNSLHQSIAKLEKEFFEPDRTVTEKRFIKDISLWKVPSPGEPYWDAPWGKGRPGWHIECSVMASMCFGGNVDIHTGAVDLRFPHHEYEIAQCDAYHGCSQWVNYFLHTGQVNVAGGQKMSKSLGNFITIDNFLAEWKDPDVLRMLCCLNLWHKSVELKNHVTHISMIEDTLNFLSMCRQIVSGRQHVVVDNALVLEEIATFENDVVKYFKRNFNIPRTMKNLRTLYSKVEGSIAESPTNFSDVSAIVKATSTTERYLDNLGFTFHRR